MASHGAAGHIASVPSWFEADNSLKNKRGPSLMSLPVDRHRKPLLLTPTPTAADILNTKDLGLKFLLHALF